VLLGKAFFDSCSALGTSLLDYGLRPLPPSPANRFGSGTTLCNARPPLLSVLVGVVNGVAPYLLALIFLNDAIDHLPQQKTVPVVALPLPPLFGQPSLRHKLVRILSPFYNPTPLGKNVNSYLMIP